MNVLALNVPIHIKNVIQRSQICSESVVFTYTYYFVQQRSDKNNVLASPLFIFLSFFSCRRCFSLASGKLLVHCSKSFPLTELSGWVLSVAPMLRRMLHQSASETFEKHKQLVGKCKDNHVENCCCQHGTLVWPSIEHSHAEKDSKLRGDSAYNLAGVATMLLSFPATHLRGSLSQSAHSFALRSTMTMEMFEWG